MWFEDESVKSLRMMHNEQGWTAIAHLSLPVHSRPFHRASLGECRPIRPFHNPCALIRFKWDSRLSALHSGRWVDKFRCHIISLLTQGHCHKVAIIFTDLKLQLLSMVFTCEAAECYSYTSKNNNQSVNQIFLQLVDSFRETRSVCHLRSSCRK